MRRRGIVLDVRCGELFLGEAGPEPAGPRTLSVYAAAYRDLARIDIVRDGACVYSLLPPVPCPSGWLVARIRVEWRNPSSSASVDWSGSLSIDDGRIVQTPYLQREVTAVADRGLRWTAGCGCNRVPAG